LSIGAAGRERDCRAAILAAALPACGTIPWTFLHPCRGASVWDSAPGGGARQLAYPRLRSYQPFGLESPGTDGAVPSSLPLGNLLREV